MTQDDVYGRHKPIMWLLIGVIGNDKANYAQAVNVLRCIEIYKITAISQALQGNAASCWALYKYNGSHGGLLFSAWDRYRTDRFELGLMAERGTEIAYHQGVKDGVWILKNLGLVA